MAKYFLDTHTFYWFLTDNERLDKNIKESIANPKPNKQYVISEFVLLEIMQLKELKKITLHKGLKGVFDLMGYYNNLVWWYDSSGLV